MSDGVDALEFDDDDDFGAPASRPERAPCSAYLVPWSMRPTLADWARHDTQDKTSTQDRQHAER